MNTRSISFRPGRVKAQYEVLKHDAHRVWIIDKNLGQVSVTNDADSVVAEVAVGYGNRRIIYRDSMGQWDELVHQEGRFIRFATTSEHP